MPGPKPTPILITPQQETLLHRITQRHTAAQRLVRRARIILLAGQGAGNAQIARKLDLGLKTVKRWRARWLEALPKLEAAAQADEAALAQCIAETLADEPRPGAPPVFSAEQVAQLFALACQKPEQRYVSTTLRQLFCEFSV
jgi:putative transposase